MGLLRGDREPCHLGVLPDVIDQHRRCVPPREQRGRRSGTKAATAVNPDISGLGNLVAMPDELGQGDVPGTSDMAGLPLVQVTDVEDLQFGGRVSAQVGRKVGEGRDSIGGEPFLSDRGRVLVGVRPDAKALLPRARHNRYGR